MGFMPYAKPCAQARVLFNVFWFCEPIDNFPTLSIWPKQSEFPSTSNLLPRSTVWCRADATRA